MNPLLSIEYLILTAGLFLAAGVFLAWKAAAKASPRKRLAICLLRAAAIAALAVVAFNPGSWRRQFAEIDHEFAVLVDRSASMNMADVNGRSRWSEACRLALKTDAAVKKAGQIPRLHTFADSLEPGTAVLAPEAAVDGDGTDILHALGTVLDRYRDGSRKLAGILLLSDGRQVAAGRLEALTIRARALEIPIHPFPLGGEVPVRNLKITPGRRQYVTFAGQRTRVSATVTIQGFSPVTVNLQLKNPDGSIAAAERLQLAGAGATTVGFELSQEARGAYDYTLELPVLQGENSTADNQARFSLLVLDRRMRVLMIEGAPFWDSKFVAQLLRKQQNLEVTSVYRISNERFFKVETDLSQVSDASEAIFPDTAAEIAAYDMIVFGKGVEYFLNDERIRLLREFVRDQGGSIIFARGKPYSAEFPALEFLEPVSWGQRLQEKFRFRPTMAGEDSGLFGELLPAAADPVWEKLPQLQYAERVSDLKAFTRILAEGELELGGGSRTLPLIISRRFGKGMITTVNCEGFWQWDFFPSVPEAGDMYKELWTQVLQWSATYSEYLPGQEFALRVSESIVSPGTPVRVSVNYRGRTPLQNPPQVRLIHAARVIQESTAAGAGREADRWDTVMTPPEPGLYHVEVAAADSPRVSITVTAPAREADNFSSDPHFLEQIARGSGGRVLTEKDLESVISGSAFREDPADVAAAVWVPEWDTLWLLMFILCCFGSEWFLRRRSGMM